MGNQERNSYVMGRIEDAAVRLLAQRELGDISIGQIVAEAQVSRNSFYRNYQSKEDVLRHRVMRLLSEWEREVPPQDRATDPDLYGSLFGYLKMNGELCLLLERRGLGYLFQEALVGMWGPPPELDNKSAYAIAFASHGISGWICEWIRRGMQESAEEMTSLLASKGTV